MTTIKAVLFDVGGVLVASPVTALHQYERLCGLPSGFVNKAIAYIPHVRDVWGEWECNKITFAEFCGKLDQHIQAEIDRSLTESERSQITKGYNTREMIDLMERYSGSKLNDKLVQCASTLRKKGIVTCIITNNWYSDATENDLEILMGKLRPHFDHIIESRLVGLRKPNPAIFEHSIEIIGNDIKPTECLFLDDLGPNLKAASTLGIHTIKVSSEEQAVRDLERTFGEKLTYATAKL